jgi:hypothetical protein
MEDELFAATCYAQDMLFEMSGLELMGLKVKKLMTLKVDNKGAEDLCDNWSGGRRTSTCGSETNVSEMTEGIKDN